MTSLWLNNLESLNLELCKELCYFLRLAAAVSRSRGSPHILYEVFIEHLLIGREPLATGQK